MASISYMIIINKWSYRCCDTEKDLGLWISKNLKWSKQCNTAANKAMSVLGIIKRSFSHISIESFKVLYNTYVDLIWNTVCKYGIHTSKNI